MQNKTLFKNDNTQTVFGFGTGNLFLVKYMITVLIFVVLNVIYSTLYETSLLTFFQLLRPAATFHAGFYGRVPCFAQMKRGSPG